MVEQKKVRLLSEKEDLMDSDCITRGYKDGIEIEKGTVVTEEFLKKNFDNIGDMLSIFTAYPDVFLDFIAPEENGMKLFFYQRVTLRSIMRYKNVYVTAPRAFSKSFITILGLMLQCIFMPGTKRFICAPGKGQSAQIAKEKIAEIYDKWPLIRREVVGGDVTDTPGNFGKDYVTLKFRNGSQFDVVGALDSTRGGRRHGGLIDEVRKKCIKFVQSLKVIFTYLQKDSGGVHDEMLYLSNNQSSYLGKICWANN